jgi:hypothetical protein
MAPHGHPFEELLCRRALDFLVRKRQQPNALIEQGRGQAILHAELAFQAGLRARVNEDFDGWPSDQTFDGHNVGRAQLVLLHQR